MGPTAPTGIQDTGLGTQASGTMPGAGTQCSGLLTHRNVKMLQSSVLRPQRRDQRWPSALHLSACPNQGQTCGCLVQTRKPETLSNFAKACSWEEVRPGRTPAFLFRALWGARG